MCDKKSGDALLVPRVFPDGAKTTHHHGCRGTQVLNRILQYAMSLIIQGNSHDVFRRANQAVEKPSFHIF